jgi:hypothetical protein
MNMMNEITEEHGTGFPIPFTLEELKQDILETMLTLLNQARFTFLRDWECDTKLWSLLSSKPLEHPSEFANPDNDAKNIGLTFQDIESIELVSSLVQFYKYGMLGLIDESMIEMDDSEGSGNWTSRILYDLHRSEFLVEWSEYRNIDVHASVARCLLVTELANARLMLEGGNEGFYLGSQDAGVLDIRQMSLLAGMTEGSIRTLAGPNRKNALITTKNTAGNGVHIEIENAKAWLKSKGRYVPIKKTSVRGAEDFTNRKFTSIAEFEHAVYERRAYLNIQNGEEVISSRLIKAGVECLRSNPVSDLMRRDTLGVERMLDAEMMARLGEALELPKALFALRAAEAVAVQRLAEISDLLKHVQQSK